MALINISILQEGLKIINRSHISKGVKKLASLKKKKKLYLF